MMDDVQQDEGVNVYFVFTFSFSFRQAKAPELCRNFSNVVERATARWHLTIIGAYLFFYGGINKKKSSGSLVENWTNENDNNKKKRIWRKKELKWECR